jgi:DNA-binding MarR family transcriptional regulator
LNHHIKELKKRGAIEIKDHDKDGRVSMISLAPHIHLLLE